MPTGGAARRLQRLAGDELGAKPHLTTCKNVLDDSERDPTHSPEEHIAAVFLAHRDRLKVSAERREAQRSTGNRERGTMSLIAKDYLEGNPDAQACRARYREIVKAAGVKAE